MEEEHIIAPDVCYHEMPAFAIPHRLTTYSNLADECKDAHEISNRLKDATIIVTSSVPISASTIARCPHLKLIVLSSVGYDHVDIEACRSRGIRVCNTPSAYTDAVAEHCIALYFSVKRRIPLMHQWTLDGNWVKDPTGCGPFEGYVPRACRQEVLGVVGYGGIGKAIARIATSLGMTTLIAERREPPHNHSSHSQSQQTPSSGNSKQPRAGRVAFEEVLKTCTVLALACPLDDSTRNTLTERELSMMQPHAIIINVARGGVVNEADIAKALQMRRIAGYATDVFSKEPASSSSEDPNPLLAGTAGTAGTVPNIVLSPHVAWYSQSSVKNMRATIKANVEAFVAGSPINVV
ncbi:hypothetical protein L228DRAFT_59289 [Xylona heveae TC161]|uniref:Glycerate dehydrogenase n=1 Tax=Xylona heveae (strain CBS 132557 / TC161) TaxID=1328760 RepID=A0A165IJ93_XYLHT|nr:hypothetical protein L228DRAFT_59289 [Xylona heveae TC161]KZF24972.1 hypothetical protein L228DRAFT_59289 [Xylona heveae TC161]